MTQTPSKGRVVFVAVDPSENNGDDYAPAVITRVWDDGRVNVKIFLDDAFPAAWRTSLRLVDDRPDDSTARSRVAWWPPRV
jgi:hypothetical protein